MAVDIHGVAVQCTADTLVRTGPGLVYAVHVCMDGATVGDSVQIQDAVAAGGTAVWTFIANATDQSYSFCPCLPWVCNTGIFVDISLTGGACYVTVVYS